MATLSTAQLIDRVADKTGASKKDVKQIVDATLETISESLAAGERLQLAGFGSFDVRDIGERPGTNPRTKEKITIPATKRVGFTAGKQLKERVVGVNDA